MKDESKDDTNEEANHFSLYGIPFDDYLKEFSNYKGSQPKHKYTISLHRAVFTEELFDLYKRYEKAVHGKDRQPSELKDFLCNSPLFDPYKEPEKVSVLSALKSKYIDKNFHS